MRRGRGTGENEFASPPPSAPYFSHSLPVWLPSRKFLETPAMHAMLFTKGVELNVGFSRASKRRGREKRISVLWAFNKISFKETAEETFLK